MPLPEAGFVVAIDGPAASGKSSTARQVALALGIRRADSGAIYRAVTAARLRGGDSPAAWTDQSVLDAASAVTVVPVAGAFEVQIDGMAADAELRGQAVTSTVSRVASMPAVRSWVNSLMRACARDGAIVVDGRDMGTAVFPDAAVKIWLVADVNVRAKRRSLEIRGTYPDDEELSRAANDLTVRDAADARQTQPAPDAIVIDTSLLTPSEQVARIVALANERIAAQ